MLNFSSYLEFLDILCCEDISENWAKCRYLISYKIAKKGKPCEMDFPLLKNNISTILRHQKRAIYCGNYKFRIDDFKS